MIKNGEVPEYKIFTNEPAKRRLRRIAKEKREAKLAEEMQKELEMDSGIQFIFSFHKCFGWHSKYFYFT